jgi:pimeloyl-ACP methyl ester carboxylesterase
MPDVKTLDSTIRYQESGTGTPFVFLHGNPGPSHLWREVLPRVGPGRLLAPDLIGMGQSGKPDIAYAFAFLESIVKPMGWDELSPQARARTEKSGIDDGHRSR